MKGCLLLQRNFAYIGHAIALNLKEKYGIEDFCGYVYMRSSYDFLKSQKNICYNTLLLDEDVHKEYLKEKLDLSYLDYLEKKYGTPNLWPYLAVDRVLMYNQLVREYPYHTPPFNHEEMLRILQVTARRIITMLEEEKPNFVLGSVFGSLAGQLLFNISKNMGIKTLVLTPACIENNWLISETYDGFSDVDIKYQKIRNGAASPMLLAARQFINNFRNKPQPIAQHIRDMLKQATRSYHLKFLRPSQMWKSINWYLKMTRQYLKQRKFKDYDSDINPWYYLIDRTKRKIRNFIGAYDLYDEFNPDEDFAFFPLHYEPEVALLLQAPFQSDQIVLIKQIARSLPFHYKLYVKEHPAMVEYRPRSFYKEIKKIPNVKLINPTMSSLDIIQKTKLVTTVTGTAGWEAVVLQKPVISFGHQYYNVLPAVTRCSEMEKLPFIIKELLENYRADDDDLAAFLAAVMEESVEVDLYRLWYQEADIRKKKEAVIEVADLVAKKMNIGIV